MRKPIIIFLLVLAVKILLQQWLIHPDYGLHRDEFLHLDQGRHLAWGYISVPPLTSWISYLLAAMGNGVFWIKLVPVLFGAGTIFLAYLITRQLRGGVFAQIAVILALTLSALLRINLLYQPNSMDIFFWTFVYYLVVKYIDTRKENILYFIGPAIAIGFLAKYNIVFQVAGLLPALLFSRERKILGSRKFLISLLIAIVMVLPNLLWQWNNDFPTLAQLKELREEQLSNVARADFLKEQVLFFFNSVFILLFAFLGFLLYPPFKKYRLILFGFVITLGLFISMKAKGYYAIGLYPVLFAFGAVYLEKLLEKGWKRYLVYALLLPVVLLQLPIIKIVNPVQSPQTIARDSEQYKSFGLLRWEDGKDHSLPQDFADMLGWQELGMIVDSAYAKLRGRGNTLILCDNYGQAGAINFYAGKKETEALSFNADYINWFPLQKKIQHVILVKEAEDDDKGRNRERSLFSGVELAGRVSNPYARELGTSVFILTDAKADINGLLQEEIRKRKAVNKP